MEIENKAIKLNAVFMGTSDLAGTVLKGLLDNGFNIRAVFTKPGPTIGRDADRKENPVIEMAQERNIPLFQPEKLDESVVDNLKNIKPDIIIVAAYGKIIPKEILELPAFGCINLHPSLLPKFRGPSPIQNAILSGEKETGVSIILMNEKMDAGDILGQERMAISESDTSQSLHQKLAEIGTNLLFTTLIGWAERKIEPQPQNESEATFCQLIEREDGHIIWDKEVQKISDRFRALYPWPGTFGFWENNGSLQRIKFHSLLILPGDTGKGYKIGEVFKIEDQIAVQALDGAVIIEKLQIENKEAVSGKDFINGYPHFIGSILK